jgi:RNA polymerase sigma-70 factor (ECF subfamily)
VSDEVPGLVDHLFRRRAGQMVSSLARIFGPAYIDLAEDVVQDALLQALRLWSFRGVPDDPAGWLFRVARNRALDVVRRDAALRHREPDVQRWLYGTAADAGVGIDADHRFDTEIEDSELALLFACCHPALTREQGIALALRTVAGFSTTEVARAFLLDEATVAQRIVRAKRRLREGDVPLAVPERADELNVRRDAVLSAIYLMFNEGYSAGEGDALVRLDLCGEGLRLARLVARHPGTTGPAVHALVALLCFQMARLPARADGRGDIILLGDQDRSRWDGALIDEGFRALDRAGAGDVLTTYHLQARIASYHAIAPTYADTDWAAILDAYDTLARIEPSPVVLVNRAIATCMVRGSTAALEDLALAKQHPDVGRYVWFHVARAHVHRVAGDHDRARDDYRRALALTFSAPTRRFLDQRLRDLPED